VERNSYGLLGFLLVLLIVPFSLPAQENSRQQLIQDRLLSDISSINDQLSRLNRTVNRLEEKVSQLKTENQRQRSRINELEKTLREVQEGSSSSSSSEPEASRAQKKTVSGHNSRSASSPSMWEPRPGVPYQIRREPLDEELIYITTDDTTLTKLAHIYYRDASFWREIYELNKDKLPSPDAVPPKVRLRLPPIDELKSQ
jgi:TolA-binding protein